jgi:hypothetical protein
MITDSYVRSKNTVLNLCRRDEFFAALKKVFYDVSGENLPIYGVVSVKLIILILATCKTQRLRNL